MTEIRDTTRQAAELAALRRMLVASQGCFSLSFAVCDDRGLRDELVRRLCEEFPGITPVALDPGTPDVYRVVRDRLIGTQPRAVFVMDLEASVPFQAEDYPTLRALNSSRELWEPLRCSVVFWLAAYAAALVVAQAPDFWRYRSHQFELVPEPKALSEAISEPIPGIEMVDALPFEEKRFRIAELEKRLQEAGPDPSSEILAHVLTGSPSSPACICTRTASERRRNGCDTPCSGPKKVRTVRSAYSRRPQQPCATAQGHQPPPGGRAAHAPGAANR